MSESLWGDILERLIAREGFSKQMIAQAAGTSLSQVRAWWVGGQAPDRDQVRELGRLAWMVDQLYDAGAKDPASLLECRLVTGFGITGMDVYRAGHGAVLLHIARGTTPAAALDAAMPNWRRESWTPFTAVSASDGNMTLQTKGIDQILAELAPLRRGTGTGWPT